MELTQIKVNCHSGYKADEHPKRFIWKDEVFNIVEIIDRWYEGYNNDKSTPADYFKVKTEFGSQYLLKHIKGQDEWFLARK